MHGSIAMYACPSQDIFTQCLLVLSPIVAAPRYLFLTMYVLCMVVLIIALILSDE
jgi:hypothetical protein